jgi:hypothetical protein
MAGTTLDRQLTASPVEAGLRFVLAMPEHDEAIRRLLRENPMRGTISLSFEREPNFFQSTGITSERDDTILAFSGGRLVCMGRCIVRPCWLDGAVRRVGYLGELRLDASVQGRFDILRRGYAFFRELHRANPADVYFTSIATDNHRAQRLLERGVTGLPAYRYLTDFVTLVVSVPRHARYFSSTRFRYENATPSRAGEIAAFLNLHASRHQLASEWTEGRLANLARHGLSLDRIQLAFADKRLIACTGLWDQREFRQTVIRGYTPVLRFMRPILNMAARVFGTIESPPVGSVVAHAFVSPLAIAPEGEKMLPEFITSMFQPAAKLGIRLLTLGFDAADPRLAIVQRYFGGRVYRTRLYQVRWPEDCSEDCAAAGHLFMPEVALL